MKSSDARRLLIASTVLGLAANLAQLAAVAAQASPWALFASVGPAIWIAAGCAGWALARRKRALVGEYGFRDCKPEKPVMREPLIRRLQRYALNLVVLYLIGKAIQIAAWPVMSQLGEGEDLALTYAVLLTWLQFGLWWKFVNRTRPHLTDAGDSGSRSGRRTP